MLHISMQSTLYIQRDDPVIRNFVAAKSILDNMIIINYVLFLRLKNFDNDDFNQQRTIYY